MATNRWLGNATAVAQVDTLTVGGTIEVGDKFKVTINGKTVTVSATTTVAATTAAEIADALAAATHPEFTEITFEDSGDTIVCTADTAGKPFELSVETTESNDDPADAQTFTRTATTASAGPNDWSTASNWSTGSVPGADDVYLDAAVDILYGLDQNAVTLTSLTIPPSFGTAKLGLPLHEGDYAEYRETYLKLNCTTCNVECDSGRIKLNFQAAQTTLNVNRTGAGVERGVEALLFQGTHASNAVNVRRGQVGVAIYGGETATMATLRIGFDDGRNSDATVRLGSGVTLSSATVTKTGGTLEINSNVATVNHYGGRLTVLGTATVTTLSVYAGVVEHKSSGTITTLNLYDVGEIDFTGDPRTRTVTTTDVFSERARINDYDKVVTWTNGIDFNGFAPSSDRIKLGRHLKLTPAAVS